MKIIINTENIRTDFKTFFEKRLRHYLSDKFKHTPFIVVQDKDGNAVVQVIDNINELIGMFGNKPDTKVIQQWPGEWRSDFFTFTIEELQTAIKNETSLKEKV